MRMEYRYADNRLKRLPALAAELVKTPCSVIVAAGASRTAAVLKEATQPYRSFSRRCQTQYEVALFAAMR